MKGAKALVAVTMREGVPRSRSRKSAGKRDAIIQAAIEIINTKSFALATMTEIAASLDLSDAALYYYFPTKQALAYAAHVQSLERFERLLEEADAEITTGAEKLTRFTRAMLEDSSDNGSQLYFGEHSYLDAAQREAIDGWANRLKATLEGFLVEGMEDGSVVPCEPEVIVQLYLGMLIWLAKWVPSIKDLTVDRLMRAIEDFCFRGIESRSPDPSGGG